MLYAQIFSAHAALNFPCLPSVSRKMPPDTESRTNAMSQCDRCQGLRDALVDALGHQVDLEAVAESWKQKCVEAQRKAEIFEEILITKELQVAKRSMSVPPNDEGQKRSTSVPPIDEGQNKRQRTNQNSSSID